MIGLHNHNSGILISLCIILLLLFPQSCGSNNNSSSSGKKLAMRYAENLTVEEYDGYAVARIRNPWDTTKLLRTYVLLDKGIDIPQGINPQDVIRVPLEKSVVYSAVHNGLINELGATDAVSGVCDAEYIFDDTLRNRIEKGIIKDCGDSMSPNVEEIIRISPGAILLSPFENMHSHGKLDHAGIPIVECADYMETSPLGRAEWMKFYGRLYGKKEIADSLFQETERQYLTLKEIASKTMGRPKILMDRIYGQTWNVPAGNSTMGQMIEDAGGKNPFDYAKTSGSLQLSPEKVLYEAMDADYWLIRFAYTPLTLATLQSDRAMYGKFKAFKNGNVYGSDSSKTRIFEDVAFHPQWLLGNLITLFHPELTLPTKSKSYFEKIKL